MSIIKKDNSRCALQMICRENCSPFFRDLLGVVRVIVACHERKNCKDLLIPSRMKDCVKLGLKASTQAEKQIGKVDVVELKDRVNDMFLDDEITKSMRERVYETFDVAQQDVYYNSYMKKFVETQRSQIVADLMLAKQIVKVACFSCSFNDK